MKPNNDQPTPVRVQPVVRDRQVWIRSRGGNPAIVGKGYPLCELMTKHEAVAEAKLWPKKFYAVRTRIVPNGQAHPPPGQRGLSAKETYE